MNSTHYQSGRAWGQTASLSMTARARRVARIATAKTDPSVMLRMVFQARDQGRFAELVDACFDGQPELDAVVEFARGVGDADTRSVAATA